MPASLCQWVRFGIWEFHVQGTMHSAAPRLGHPGLNTYIPVYINRLCRALPGATLRSLRGAWKYARRMPGLPWIPYDALLMLLLPLCLSGIAFGLGCAMATVDQPLMMQHIPCPCLVHACLFDATPCPELQLRTRSNYRAQDQQELAATEWSNMADEGTSDDMVTVEVESPSPTRPSTSRAREASSETEPVIPAAPAPPGGRLEVREPAGPPPPRPIQELWQISTAISAVARTMADHSGVEPERVVTHLPHFWPSFRSVAVHVQAMPHADADHPNLLICSDEAPEEPEEPASKTEGAPTAAAHHPAPAAARTTEAETSDAGAPADVDASAADMSSPAEIRARWARLSPGGAYGEHGTRPPCRGTCRRG